MLLKNAKLYQTQTRRFVPGDLLVEDGVIRAIGTIHAQTGEVFDLAGACVVPGLVDVHTHGRAGYDFTACDSDALDVMAADYARHGVTSVMPTLASAPYEDMLASTERLCRFVPANDEAGFVGVHWEGRYLNPDKRGAHATTLLAPLDPAELDAPILRRCGALHISAALELDTDGAFAQKARSLGATLGLGHTAATYAQSKLAEGRGIVSYTHLFNAMPPLHHRDGGAVCAALEGDCFAELICDGIHIAPEMIRLAVRAKGVSRVTLISDSMEATGAPDGEYSIAGEPVTVKDGIARTHSGALAGSTLTLDRAVNNLMDFCGIPLTDAILAATASPARQMGIYDTVGSLEEGKQADLLVLRDGERLDIDRVMVRGHWLS